MEDSHRLLEQLAAEQEAIKLQVKGGVPGKTPRRQSMNANQKVENALVCCAMCCKGP